MTTNDRLLHILCDYWKIRTDQIQSMSLVPIDPPAFTIHKIMAPYVISVICGKTPDSGNFKADFSGRAKGMKWEAGRSDSILVSSWIKYEGPLENLLTPTKIPKILDKLGRLPTPVDLREKLGQNQERRKATPLEVAEQTATEFGMLFQPAKALGMLATADKEISIESWELRNKNGLTKSRNPIIENRLKGTTLKTFFKNDQVKIQIGNKWEYPENIDQLRGYVAAAFPPESYAAMLALSYLSEKQGGKQRFSVRVPDLCKLIYGPGYTTSQKQKILNTINALQNATLHMITPHTTKKGRKDEIEHIFTPLLLSQSHWKNGKENGTLEKLELILWPQADGKEERKFTTAMVPESVFKLNQRDFPLYSYLLVEISHHAKNGKAVKLNEESAMRAAGLAGTYRSNPRKAKADLKNKLKRMVDLGIIGELKGISAGIVTLSKSTRPTEALD